MPRDALDNCALGIRATFPVIAALQAGLSGLTQVDAKQTGLPPELAP